MRCLAILGLLILGAAASGAPKPPLIVLLVPGLKAEDLSRAELQPLQHLAWQGAYGWMNARAARVPESVETSPGSGPGLEAACLTINAGSRAAAPADSIEIAALISENAAVDHSVPIGALGDMLRKAGLKTAALGSADEQRPRNPGRLIAMDSGGGVTVDLTGKSSLVRDPAAPYGLRSNLALFTKPPRADFQVWVFGDLWRADRYAPLCAPAVAARHRATALSRLGQFLDIAAPLAHKREAAFLLLSPLAALTADRVDRLAPILRFGSGVDRPGTLVSPSTRRDGLVTNTDLLPTIARYFDLRPPPGAVGRPVFVSPLPPERRNTGEWAGLHKNWLSVSRNQAAFGGMPALQFPIVVAGILAWRYYRRSAAGAYRRAFLACAAAILALPLAQLLLPLLGIAATGTCALLLLLVTGAISILAAVRETIAQRLVCWLCSGLIAALIIDLLLGQPMLNRGWMSYSVMEGGRYYGIGNEYAGAALGAVGALGLLTFARIRPLYLAAGFGLFGLLAGLPSLGADAGALTAFTLAAVAVIAAGIAGRKGLLFQIAGVALTGILIAALILADAGRAAPDQSHLGRAVEGGTGAIAYRKLALNAHLLLHSKWTLCLLAAGCGLWLRSRRPGPSRPLHSSQRAAAAGLLLGAAAMLLLNDSGVVAAANTLLVWWGSAFLTDANASPEPPNTL